MDEAVFAEFPKIARYSREAIVTEKIDGTNAQVYIADVFSPGFIEAEPLKRLAIVGALAIWAGSRTRWITPEDDNFGFASWVKENAESLIKLGPGRHFGEWYGSGIQRGYGLVNGERRWSLFNVSRWCLHNQEPKVIPQPDPRKAKVQDVLPACVGLVPELWRGPFDDIPMRSILERLQAHGSYAAPGFLDPEGVVIYHTAGNALFKKTLAKDAEPKSKQ